MTGMGTSLGTGTGPDVTRLDGTARDVTGRDKTGHDRTGRAVKHVCHFIALHKKSTLKSILHEPHDDTSRCRAGALLQVM